MKINTFLVNGLQSEAFSWSLGLYGASKILGVLDGWVSEGESAHVVGVLQGAVEAFQGSGAMLDASQGVSPVTILEGVISLAASLTMWGILSRCFFKRGRVLSFVLLTVIMVLSFVKVVLGLPVWGFLGRGFVNVSALCCGYAGSFAALAMVFLGIVISCSYVGKMRIYGLWLALSPVLLGGVSLLNYYLYNVASGLTLSEIATYVNMGSIAGLVLTVLPMALLRRALERAY